MKIQVIHVIPYKLSLYPNKVREGIHIKIVDAEHRIGYGEIAPLPNWSSESLQDCLGQLEEKQVTLKEIVWSIDNWTEKLISLQLLPSVSFGLESAILSLINPLRKGSMPVSALLMGTPQEILKQAEIRTKEGYRSAKLKVSNLYFKDASEVINQLKEQFRLRIDVNRAWSTKESLKFFNQFPVDTFDYVEEPFQDPRDLEKFTHPLAIDESFPNDLTLDQLSELKKIKALIYKPTMQGGLANCYGLKEWADKRGIALVLSSSFESPLGLAHVASIAKRLDLLEPVGIGTYHFMQGQMFGHVLTFDGPMATIDLS